MVKSARELAKRCQTVKSLAEQKRLEDVEDYQAAVAAMVDLTAGRVKIFRGDELWHDLELI